MGDEVDPLALHAVLLPTDAPAVCTRRSQATLQREEVTLRAAA